MITLTNIVETDAVYSEDMKKRYELTKKFKGEKGKSILVIMMNPSSQDITKTDSTTNLLLNHLCNVSNLGYTTITIWNLFADICTKLKPALVNGNDDNIVYLDKLLERDYDNILIGWGNTFKGNKTVIREKIKLSNKLVGFKERLVHIVDPDDEISCSPMHPLYAGQRLKAWELSRYILPNYSLDGNEIEGNLKDELNITEYDVKRKKAISKLKDKSLNSKKEEKGER